MTDAGERSGPRRPPEVAEQLLDVGVDDFAVVLFASFPLGQRRRIGEDRERGGTDWFEVGWFVGHSKLPVGAGRQQEYRP